MACAVSSCKSASLVVMMLVLAALVASAQATGDSQQVLIQNTLLTRIKCNGVEILAGADVKLNLNLKLEVAVLGLDGKWVQGACDVPKDVAILAVIVNVKGDVEVKVKACLGGLIHQVWKTLLGFVCLTIKVHVSL